jgi:HK97 family phage prohead protease
MNTLETRVFGSVELRLEGDGATRKLSGHAAVFNSFSLDMGFREIIRPGAFAGSLSRNPDVRLLLNHDGLPLARTVSKTLKLHEDKRGLRFEAELDATDPDVQRILPKVKRGDLNQMSFAFSTIKDNWRTENGEDVRELHELEINDGDVSLVTYPAYPATDAAVRSHDQYRKTFNFGVMSVNSLRAMKHRTI